MKSVLWSLFLVLLVSCQNKNEIEKKEIETIVNKLYEKQEGIYEKTRDSLFSKALLQKIEAIRDITKKDVERIEKSNFPTDKPILLEGAVYSSLGDGFTKYIIKTVEIKGKKAEATIDFEYNSNPLTKWSDKIQLINESGWKVDNIIFDTKISSSDDINEKLDPIGFDPNFFKDVITNKKGERLKLLHDLKNDTYTIIFNNEKATLKYTNASEKIYSDANYKLTFKEDEISLNKNNQPLFITKFPISFDKVNEAKNYFLKNDYPEKELHALIINDETELNKYFGAATKMGKEGIPTKIDFTKNYAVAVIGKTNEYGNTLWVMGIRFENKELEISTTETPIDNDKKQSYSSRPTKILLIEKKYQGTITLDHK